MMEQSLTAVICVLNSQYIHSSLAPWCLLAGIETYCEAGISAEVIEGTVNEDLAGIAERIIAKSPRIIGFCCYIWNITATKQLLRLVQRKLPNVTMVLGGPEVSYNAADLLRQEEAVQYVVSGEGEKPFALLLQAIRRGEAVPNIPGVCYRKGEQIITVPPYTPEGEPPSPYTKPYFAALKGRIAYLETSRGCPYHCAFCLSGRCGTVRFFGLERAKKELLLLANSGTQTVKLVDRTFNVHRKRAMELFHFIIDNYGAAIPQGVCIHFEIAGDLLDEETLSLLATAPLGAIQLEIGLQSFNPKTLQAIKRETDVMRLQKNISCLVAKGNIHIHLDLIAGLPYEDLKSFAESFNLAYALKPQMLQLGFLKLLHGAPMREEPEKYPCRYRQTPPYEVSETPWLAAVELLRLRHIEDALEHLYNSGRFRRTLAYLLQQTGDTPFALLDRFGEYAAGKGTDGISLDDYTALVLEYFRGVNGIDPVVLRDVMVCDRLATNASGRLPAVLQVTDPALKRALKALRRKEAAGTHKGVKRGYALLYSKPCLVYVDYQIEKKNPITGEYPLVKFPLDSTDVN
jgi:tRNA A37 methylthiotransferase MiaB